MSKKIETNFQPKFTRNDRFAQMSHQEKLIEQKKKEILAKIEASKGDTNKPKPEPVKPAIKSSTTNVPASSKDIKNIFSNDGSFLDQFKQLKDMKKVEPKSKSLKRAKDLDKCFSEDKSKSNRWTPRRRSPSPKDRLQKRVSRFSSEKVPNFEQKITISTSFSSSITQSLESQHIAPIIAQDVTGQPLLKNIVSDSVTYPSAIQQDVAIADLCTSQCDLPQQQQLQQTEVVITSPPVLLNMPPPQIVQGQINNAILLNQGQPTPNLLMSTSLQPILTTVNLSQPLVTNPQALVSPNIAPVPPPCLPSVELSSIPPPNPIQVQNIPPPEPLNTLNIPPPEPIQVQNIPTPNSMQLNEIPNPKPLDLMTIPTPNEEKTICDSDFLKNIPPPNKSIPPPQLTDTHIQTITIPQSVLTIKNLQPAPSPNIMQAPQPFAAVTVALVSSASTLPNPIPSLMAQPIMPPPGMGINCPPPLLSVGGSLQVSMPSYVNRPPPLINQMPPTLTIPPPTSAVPVVDGIPGFPSMSNVFPPGSAEYESMASLARMVAECGQCIEDMVVQRKNQDPTLWFLHHKNSAAYQQYRRLIEELRQENGMERLKQEQKALVKVEDKYEPERALEEDYMGFVGFKQQQVKKEEESTDQVEIKRKRKSRWGDNDSNISPPAVLVSPQTPLNSTEILAGFLPKPQKPVLLSKITRNDPDLLRYVSAAYKTLDLSEEDWKKAEENYKVHLLYQDMLNKRAEVENLAASGKQKYEYDSDEDTEGGTWEHKLRDKEMTATQVWAQELTRQAEGKHHIGDFLPPEEFKRFMEKSSAIKAGRQPNLSDYKEFKIKEDNIGFKMLQKLGWSEGEGLGSSGSGILEPINKGAPRDHAQGLGLNQIEEDEDEYETYRKRMMLAYRFRPNPLNNPRRPYY